MKMHREKATLHLTTIGEIQSTGFGVRQMWFHHLLDVTSGILANSGRIYLAGL